MLHITDKTQKYLHKDLTFISSQILLQNLFQHIHLHHSLQEDPQSNQMLYLSPQAFSKPEEIYNIFPGSPIWFPSRVLFK